MKTYLVGGAVRDQLLNIPVKDKDWVVVGATSQQMLDLGYQQVGADFPVFLHPTNKEEYALARTERKSGKGYQGFSCFSDSTVTLEQDLMRRDLTINAMAQDKDGNIIDPYCGQQDLHNKCLKHVSSAFQEDPLRILRVARFLARFYHLGFQVAEETNQLMITMVEDGEANHLVSERVWTETLKALGEQNPNAYFNTLKNCGALQVLSKELDQYWQELPNIDIQHVSEIERFAFICLNFPMDSIESMSKNLKLAKKQTGLLIALTELKEYLPSIKSQSAELILSTIKKLNALKSDELINSIEKIYSITQETVDFGFLISITLELKKLSPKALIEQGITGKQLGQALEQEQLRIIEQAKIASS